MLRHLRNHVFAVRLHDVFAQSPLVLVYQALGQVDRQGVSERLQERVAQQLPSADIRVDVCHMKNTVAAATDDETLGRLFNNTNILVGFKLPLPLPQQQQQGEQHVLQGQQQQQKWRQPEDVLRIRQGTPPRQIVGGLLERPMPGPHLPQPVLRALVEIGVALPSAHPMVLVGAFYKRGSTPLAHLKEWVKLDAGQVYGELLGALESPVEGVLAVEGPAEELLGSLDDAGGDVAMLLDFQAARQPSGGQGQ